MEVVQMKRILFFLFSVAAIVAWCTPGFARENIPADVASPGQLSAEGVLNGVSLTGLTTLLVGTVGGAEKDIFTNNSALASATPAVSASANLQGTVTFNASSTVDGDLGATGTKLLLITAGDGTTVNILGSTYAGTMNSGTGTTSFGANTTNIVAPNFTGDGTISLGLNSTLTGALTTNTANVGTLSLASGSSLTGAVGGANGLKSINVTGGSNTAGVTATITGAVNSHAFSLGTNELDIGGALTIATNGVINTTLASSTVYGHIVVLAGNASGLGTGLAVDGTVTSTSLLLKGTQFNIVQSTSGTGALATVVNDPGNPLYTFSVVTSVAAGYAAITLTSAPLSAPIGTSGPAAPVATVLAAITSPSAALTPILAAINALTTTAAVVNAEAQLSPLSPALAAPLITFRGAREFQNLWLSRLDMCDQFSHFYKDDPSCQENNPRSGWWAKAFGNFGKQDDRGGFTGYDSIIAGSMIAYDAPLPNFFPDTRAGLGLGYARSIIKGKGFDTQVNFDTYQATAYIGHEQGPWFINGSESFGWNQYTGRRDIQYPGVNEVAKAGYFGQDYTTFLDTGYHFSAPKQFTVTPLVSLQYSRVNIDAYTESGAGDLNLHVKPQLNDFLESGLGTKIERGFNYHNWTFVPEIHFKWLYDFLNPALKQTAQLQSVGATSFTTPGLKTSPNIYDAGAGITLLSCTCSKRKWSLDAVYDYFWRADGYSANQATLRFTTNF